jgi:hypothetical protein
MMEKLVAVKQSEDQEGTFLRGKGCGQDDKEWKIANAECAFVHNDFHRALHLANEVLQESLQSESPPTTPIERVELLQTPVFSTHWKALLVLDDTIQMADRAGAIALQCIYATNLDDTKVMLEPFLEFYSKSPIPLGSTGDCHSIPAEHR